MKKNNIKKKARQERFFRVIKYLLTGALGMFTDVGLFFLLAQILFVHVLIANSIATVVATSLNFIIQKMWSFKSKETDINSIIKYASVWFFNYSFTMFYLFITVEYFGFVAGWMKLSTYIFITVWNYFLYKNYVYKK